MSQSPLATGKSYRLEPLVASSELPALMLSSTCWIWSPRTGQVLEASAETGNPEDRHAVALQQTGEGVTLGHMPREVSKVLWFFLRHGGYISFEITGRRKRSTVPGKGL